LPPAPLPPALPASDGVLSSIVGSALSAKYAGVAPTSIGGLIRTTTFTSSTGSFPLLPPRCAERGERDEAFRGDATRGDAAPHVEPPPREAPGAAAPGEAARAAVGGAGAAAMAAVALATAAAPRRAATERRAAPAQSGGSASLCALHEPLLPPRFPPLLTPTVLAD